MQEWNLGETEAMNWSAVADENTQLPTVSLQQYSTPQPSKFKEHVNYTPVHSAMKNIWLSVVKSSHQINA